MSRRPRDEQHAGKDPEHHRLADVAALGMVDVVRQRMHHRPDARADQRNGHRVAGPEREQQRRSLILRCADRSGQ